MTPPLNVADQPQIEKSQFSIGPWLLPWSIIVACGAALNPWFVPGSNEFVYLMVLRTKADPAFLARDWTFATGFDEHHVFNLVFAPVSALIGVEALAWIGRGVTWAASAAIILMLANALRVNRWLATGGVVIWLAIGQGFVAYSTMIDVFEANSVAVPILVAGLVAALRGRIPLALGLAGLSLSLHPGVGLWGCLAIGIALVAEPTTRWKSLRWSWIGVVTALPGLIPLVTGNTLTGSQDYEYLVLERMPYHIDPFYFPRRGVIAFALMAVVILAYGWVRRSSPSYRITTWFAIGLLIPFGVGVVARLVEAWSFLILFPFRLGSLLIPLIALLYTARMIEDRAWSTFTSRQPIDWAKWIAVGCAALVVIWVGLLMNPVLEAARSISMIADEHARYSDDLSDVFTWTATGTPQDAVVIMPPWREDSTYTAERAQIASWKAVVYSESAEWRRRIEAQTGGDLPDGTSAKTAAMESFYTGLSEQAIVDLASTYGAGYIITESTLPFPELYRKGGWAIYAIAP